MPGPIKPSEIGEAKTAFIPEAVFDVFNRLIALDFSNGSATVKQDDVVRLLTDGGMDRNTIFKDGYLNVEDAYRAQGWTVEYDKPGYNESYDAFFKFSK